MKLGFPRQIFEKILNIKFNQNSSTGSRVVVRGRTERRTDMKLTVLRKRLQIRQESQQLNHTDVDLPTSKSEICFTCTRHKRFHPLNYATFFYASSIENIITSLLSSPLADIDDIRASIYKSIADFQASSFRLNTTVILREMGFFCPLTPNRGPVVILST
jgi:hypothetical protein